jgi:Tol biopolymer transport system component
MDRSTHDERGYDIYLMNYKTKKVTRLTDSRKTEQGPVIVKVKK